MNEMALQARVLRTLAKAHFAACPLGLDELTERLGVRRDDVRRAISALHRAGHVDAARFRLTLSGFALGRALRGARLAPLRSGRGILRDDVAA
jgi:DNA-binding IclR family transcriptional regulator